MRAYDRALGLVHLTLLGLGIAVVAYGFYDVGPQRWEVWLPEGWARFKVFVAVAVAVAVAVPLLSGRRWPAAVVGVAAAAVVGLFGVGPALAVGYLLTACLCLGRLTFGRFRQADDDPVAGAATDALIGFAVLTAVMNVTLHFRVNFSLTYAAALAVPVALGRRRLAADVTAAWRVVRAPLPVRPPVAVAGAAAAVPLLAHAVLAALPERYWDALVYHLTICTTVAAEGRWSFDPAFAFSFIPMNGDWCYVAGYLLAGEPAARLVNLLFFALTLVLLYSALRPRCGAALALLGVALLASTPVAFIETASLFIENALTAFLFAAFAVAVRRFDAPRAGDAVTVAVLLGAAAATKLHAVVFAALLVPVVCAAAVRAWGLWPGVKAVAPAFLAGAVFAAPPYLNAYRQTGNPVFPFYNAVFKSPFYESDKNFALDMWSGLGWRLPYDLTFRTDRYVEGWGGAVGFHLLALGLAGAAVAVVRRDRAGVIALGLSAGYLLVTGSHCVYVRYLYPLFPLLLLACLGPGLRMPGAWPARRATAAAGLALVGLNLYFLPTGGWILRTFDANAAVSARKRLQLLEGSVPERQLVTAVNAVAGRRSKVMFVGNPYAAGLMGKWCSPTWYHQAFGRRFEAATGTNALAELLCQEGVTHVIVSANAVPAAGSPLSGVLARNAAAAVEVGGAQLHTLLPPPVEVVDYAPRTVKAGEAFCAQPGGGNGLWAKLAKPVPPKTVARWNGTSLGAALAADRMTVSALVPEAFTAAPGQAVVELYDPDSRATVAKLAVDVGQP